MVAHLQRRIDVLPFDEARTIDQGKSIVARNRSG
jgi:hypothetical protein